jgi:aspartate kinase
MRGVVLSGVAIVRDEARVALQGVPDEPGISHQIFSAVAGRQIVVDMIAQSVGSQGRAAIGFTVPRHELPTTLTVLRPLLTALDASIEAEQEVSKVSVVGTGMRTHTGVAERMFAALAEADVNLKMITTSDIKISVLVSRSDGMRALRAVHRAFDLASPRPGAGLPPAGGAPAPFQRRPAPAVGGANSRDLNALTQQLASMEDIVVSDVILAADEGRITVVGLPDHPGNCSRVFQAVASGGIIVDMIVQNLTGGHAELSFSVPQTGFEKALTLTREACRSIDRGTQVAGDATIAKLYVLGVGMRTHTGVARRMFGALARRGINISMINTSEVRVTVVVDRDRGDEALACLREAFGLG